MSTEIDVAKSQFILQYVLNARLSGRAKDLDGTYERRLLVDTAVELYDLSIAACTPKEPESTNTDPGKDRSGLSFLERGSHQFGGQ